MINTRNTLGTAGFTDRRTLVVGIAIAIVAFLLLARESAAQVGKDQEEAVEFTLARAFADSVKPEIPLEIKGWSLEVPAGKVESPATAIVKTAIRTMSNNGCFGEPKPPKPMNVASNKSGGHFVLELEPDSDDDERTILGLEGAAELDSARRLPETITAGGAATEAEVEKGRKEGS